MENHTLAWDTLNKRGITGQNICIICNNTAENIDHFFVECVFYKNLWSKVLDGLQVYCCWNHPTLEEKLLFWIKRFPHYKTFPFFNMWGIWKTKNALVSDNIFQDSTVAGL